MFPKQALRDIFQQSSFLQQLSKFGFAAADIPNNVPFLEALRSDIVTLEENKQLVPNWSRFVKEGTTTALQKTGIYENNLPLDNPYSAPALENLWENRHWITDTINNNNNNNNNNNSPTNLPQLLPPSMKIQYNSGDGACFPCHFDSDAQVDDRCCTLILYLNPEYLTVPSNAEAAQAQGGHVICYPIPFPPVSFSPAMGRMVAFSSRNMLHRTLPCRSTDPRICLTLWFPQEEETSTAATAANDIQHNTITREDFMPFVQVSDDDVAALNILLEPDMRPHLARLMLAGEWIDSLRASHTDQQTDVNTYVDKSLVQDLSTIEAVLVGHVQSKGGLKNFTPGHLRDLSSKLPLLGERHQLSDMNWWL
jgi:hypothetical protein